MDELLIHRIYDAADTPGGLGVVLPAIGQLVGTHQGQTLVLERGDLVDHHYCGHDVEAFEEYNDHWQAQDPRFAIAARHPGAVLSDVAVIDPAAFERSAIYNEHLTRTGVRYTLFSIADVAPGLQVGQAFLRARHLGPFGPEDVARLTALLPHLSRAVRLRHLVGSLTDRVEDLGRVLDAAPAAVAVLDRAGRFLFASATAEELIARGDALLRKGGVLTAFRPGDARALAAAVARAASFSDAGALRPAPARLATTVAIARELRPPLGVVVLPLRPRSALRSQGHGAARVLVVLDDPERIVRLDAALIAELHGLTATEAALAVAIAEGKSLLEYAEARGCTELTARTHLKRIFSKTETRGQPDLVRVLLTGAGGHRVG